MATIPTEENNYRQKDGAVLRKLNIRLTLEKCKAYCPMNLEILKSNLDWDTGFKRDTVTDYLKVLFDTKRITIENDIVKVRKE